MRLKSYLRLEVKDKLSNRYTALLDPSPTPGVRFAHCLRAHEFLAFKPFRTAMSEFDASWVIDYPEMREEEAVNKLRVVIKRTDRARWDAGDIARAQQWDEEKIADVAQQLDVEPKTLVGWRDTAITFRTNDWRKCGASWGVLTELRVVKKEKDRWAILNEKEDPSKWTRTSMQNRVRQVLRKQRTETVNAKREARGLPPVEDSVIAKFMSEKAGFNLFGVAGHCQYDKLTRTVTIVFDAPLEDPQILPTRGSETRLIGTLPLPDVDEDAFL